MTIDLHCHTKMSDGSTGIQELINIAKLREVKIISITDHDTFAGSKRAVILGKRTSVTVVPGVEISAIDNQRNRKVHILCYFPKNSDRLEGMLKKITDNRRAAMSISIQKVARIYPIPMDMVITRATGSTNIYKQHIMQALMDAGYTNELFGDVFTKLFHPKFGLAYTKIEYPDVNDVIDEVHSAGGVAILAHPTVYDSMDLMMELFEKKKLDGAEAYHPRNSEEDIAVIKEHCIKYKKAMTGGTDFHGSYSTSTNMLGTYSTPDDQYTLLKALAR